MPPLTHARTPITGADDLDILSAIWILSCNDENSIITYRGLNARLDLPEARDLKALVKSRRELFRPGIMKSRLDRWKTQMKAGKSLPGWIAEITDPAAREREIEALTRDDVFRNQFRVGENAPRSELETMQWGLDHIATLQKSRAEEREEKTKRWATIVIPTFSIALALVSIGVNGTLQWQSMNEQSGMKRYEVSFKPKQEGYAKFMEAISQAGLSAATRDKGELLKRLFEAEEAFYQIEPFLPKATRIEVVQKLASFGSTCNALAKADPAPGSPEHDAFLKDVGIARAEFQNELYENLFGAAAIR